MPNVKKKKDDNGNDMYVIDLNKEGFDLDDYRKIQLIAYFHMLKMNFKGETFNQLSSDEENIYIPYTFSLDEEIALVSIHGMKMLYIEFTEEEYIEITFDEIRIVIEDEEIRNNCINILHLVHAYDLIPAFDVSKFTNEKMRWQRILLNEYSFAMGLGEKFIKNGYILCYPTSGDAFVVNKKEELDEVRGNIEYLAIRSNIYEERSILFSHQFQEVIMLGFFPKEMEEIKSILYNGRF